MSRVIDWENPGDDDLRWALEWERFREMREAGYEPEDVREMLRRESQPPAAEPEEDEVPPADDDTRPYEEWKIGELRAECKARQLPGDGNRETLIERLRDDDAATDPDS